VTGINIKSRSFTKFFLPIFTRKNRQDGTRA
jgi:hypothetical protein